MSISNEIECVRPLMGGFSLPATNQNTITSSQQAGNVIILAAWSVKGKNFKQFARPLTEDRTVIRPSDIMMALEHNLTQMYKVSDITR